MYSLVNTHGETHSSEKICYFLTVEATALCLSDVSFVNNFPNFVDETRRLGVSPLRDEPPRTLRDKWMHENYGEVD